jgi:hypothetical protein
MEYQSFMARAIELSKHGLGRTFPNPIVGAVIVSASGEVIGEGFHAGGDHAEVMALLDCAKRGTSTPGSTITLAGEDLAPKQFLMQGYPELYLQSLIPILWLWVALIFFVRKVLK